MSESKKLLAFRAHIQGLDGSLSGQTAKDTLQRTGWQRTVGGAGTYLGLRARCGLGRESVDQEVAQIGIHELPCARGCTYLVPEDHYSAALLCGQGFSDAATFKTAEKFLEVTREEISILEDEICKALTNGPMDPNALKKVVGEHVRSFGDEGKKRGITTTLPIALGFLQSHGRIRRISTNGRLDNQRYAYALWSPNPLRPVDARDDAVLKLASSFWSWIGPASKSEFKVFSGLTVKEIDAALAELPLAPFDENPEQIVLPNHAAAYSTFTPPQDECIRLLGCIDNLIHLRRNVQDHLIDGDLDAYTAVDSSNALVDASYQLITDRGRVIGLWEFDSFAQELVWHTFNTPTDAVRAEIQKTEKFIQDELGDMRSFSLDSPESRKPKIERLRSLSR